jgi:hypothetical protein
MNVGHYQDNVTSQTAIFVGRFSAEKQTPALELKWHSHAI